MLGSPYAYYNIDGVGYGHYGCGVLDMDGRWKIWMVVGEMVYFLNWGQCGVDGVGGCYTLYQLCTRQPVTFGWK